MRRYLTLIVGIVIAALGILALTTLFTMPQTQQGLVLRLGNPIRTITANAVDLATKDGWRVDLPISGERVNVDPKLQLGTLIVASNIPANDACTAPTPPPWRRCPSSSTTCGRIDSAG